MRAVSSLIVLIMVGMIPTFSHAAAKVSTPTTTVDTFSEDEWYGPGYYYGYWQDNPDNYWTWRKEYYYYPSNRNYYSRYHRIYYRDDGNYFRRYDRRYDRRDRRYDRRAYRRGY